MPKGVIVPLESTRLTECITPIDCYICGSTNSVAAEFCSYCAAPMALAHQAGNPKTKPHMLAILGAPGAGKTTYLGMLMDMLSRQTSRLQMLARGAFSITLQQTTVAWLARCRFPDPTPEEPQEWNWVYCQVRLPRRRQPLELVVPDISGSALVQEMDHPRSYPVIRAFLRKSAAAMILLDVDQLRQQNRRHEFFAMKLLSYLTDLDDRPARKRFDKPVVTVLAKADCCPSCNNDPEGFVRQHATGFWQLCSQRLQQHTYFVTAVAGGSVARRLSSGETMQVPLRIEPKGVIEPLQWLLRKIARRRWGLFGRRKDPTEDQQRTNWAFPVF